MLLIPYLTAVLTGFLLIKILLGKDDQFNFLLKLSLSLIIGCGLNAIITFYSFLVFGQYNQTLIITLSALTICLLGFLNRNSFLAWLQPLASVKKYRLTPDLIAFIIISIGLAICAWLVATWIPYGRWDAWSLYNMKAKFLILGGDRWTAMFNELHWHTQPDYPLLLQFITTWFTALSGLDIHSIALPNAIVLTVNCGILLFAGLKQTSSKIAALFALFLISFNGKYLILGTAQYADILLASYLLGTIILITAAFEQKSWRVAALAGLCSGLMTFTKNEGIVLALILTAISALVLLLQCRRTKEFIKMLPAMLAGLFVSASAGAIFKLFLAPPNRDMMGEVEISQLKFFNWGGFKVTLNAFTQQFIHQEWSYIWIIIGVMLVFGFKRLLRLPHLITAVFFAGYFTVLFYIYMTTRNFDISWRISVSIDRICFYLLPSLMFLSFATAFPKEKPFINWNIKGLPLFKNLFPKNPKQWKTSILLAMLGVLLILVAAYFPVLTTEYVYHDDVNLFLKSPMQPLPVSTRTNFLVYGRFIGAAIYMLSSWPVRFISDLQYLRFFTILQLLLCARVLYPFVRKLLPNTFSAILLTGTFFTLPAFQVLVANAGMSFDAAGILFASFAAAVANKVNPESKFTARCKQRAMIWATFLFFCALTVHQATAMFYFGFAALIIFTEYASSISIIRNKIINFITAGFAGMGFYAFLLKAIKPLTIKYVGGMNNPFEMRFDIWDQIVWFFNEPVYNALNLWAVFPNNVIASLIKLIIVSGIILYFFSMWGSKQATGGFKGSLKKTLLIAAASLLFLILSFLPNLITVARQPLYRCLSGVYIIVFGLIIWSVFQWLHVLSSNKRNITIAIFSLLLTIYAISATNKNLLLYRVIPSSTLTKFLKDEFKKRDMTKYKRIHYFYPQIEKLQTRWDEFGMITVGYDHDWVGLTACGLIEKHKGEKEFRMVLVDFERQTNEYYFMDKKTKEIEIYSFMISGSEYIPNMPYNPTILPLDYTQFFKAGAKLNYLVKEK